MCVSAQFLAEFLDKMRIVTIASVIGRNYHRMRIQERTIDKLLQLLIGKLMKKLWLRLFLLQLQIKVRIRGQGGYGAVISRVGTPRAASSAANIAHVDQITIIQLQEFARIRLTTAVFSIRISIAIADAASSRLICRVEQKSDRHVTF